MGSIGIRDFADAGVTARAGRSKYSGSKSNRFFSGPTSISPCLLSGRRVVCNAIGPLIFISRSLGPKKRIFGRFCFAGPFISSIGRMTMRVAFVRKKRWKNVMTMPEEKSEISAIRAVASAFMKSRRSDCTSTGMTSV